MTEKRFFVGAATLIALSFISGLVLSGQFNGNADKANESVDTMNGANYIAPEIAGAALLVALVSPAFTYLILKSRKKV